MKKIKTYGSLEFPPEVIERALEIWLEHAGLDSESDLGLLHVERGDEAWEYDNLEQFLAGLRGDRPSRVRIDFSRSRPNFEFDSMKGLSTSLAVGLESRVEINQVFDPLDRYGKEHPEKTVSENVKKPTVFIGHGHSPLWRELRDHLQDMHGYVVEAYETGVRAGHTVRDILQEMLDSSSFALLVVTAEDETAKGDLRPRQNVVHELGLFQGRLGFSKAVAIVEEGVEMNSNMDAVHQIRFDSGNIRTTFGEIVATLERESGRRTRHK